MPHPRTAALEVNHSSFFRHSPFVIRHSVLFLVAAASAFHSPAADFTSDGLEFFEKRIRPVLMDRCFKCHSAQSEKLKGGLRLDSRAGLLKGGDTRAAIVPGDPERSLLLEAIRYGNLDLQMPPKGKLTDQQIADFTAWLKMDAPWPKEEIAPSVAKKEEFDLTLRKQTHWCWQPVRQVKPPEVADKSWSMQPVDHFILAKLEENKIKPAPQADKLTLLRRVHFDLTGLPPMPEEVEAFSRDNSTGAYEKVVDRLLASPRFGERWARHWLDLVRYAETLGHEFDFALPNAWRYRDFVIRAFNADVPYDQFVTEHIAGDLLTRPRRHPTEGFNESIIGPAFYWLNQQTHSPVDVRQHQADVIDNQIDVLTKTFLGVTVACARCHDHKFDAISTKDFYALYGTLSSSRYAQQTIDAPDRLAAKAGQLARLKEEIREVVGREWSKEAQKIEGYLLATREALVRQKANSDQKVPIPAVAAEFKVDPDRLATWIKVLQDEKIKGPKHPLYAWAEWAKGEGRGGWSSTFRLSGSPDTLKRELQPDTHPASPTSFVLGDFGKSNCEDWRSDGVAFAVPPTVAGEILIGSTNQSIAELLSGGWKHSGALSRKFEGALRSPTFTLDQRYLHILASGRGSRLNVVIDNFIVIQDPIYGTLKRKIDHEEPRWTTIDLDMWKGHRGYVEFCDLVPAEPGGGPGGSTDGYIAVRRVLLSDQASPPAVEETPSVLTLLDLEKVDSSKVLATQYRKVIEQAVLAWQAKKLDQSPRARAQLALLQWLVRSDLLGGSAQLAGKVRGEDQLEALVNRYREIEASIPSASTVPSMADGTGLDEHVFIRGAYKNPGPLVPRRFLEAIAGTNQPPIAAGCGRLELARHVTDPANPLTARVMVNRVWHHLFGQGLVPTVDNFGVLGQPPTHPELLDWLARRYQHEGWSTKKLIRLLVTSRAYQMSSKPSDQFAEEKDSNNTLLHRMRVRRLESEAIRDATLFVSGRLDEKMFGPPVPIYLTPFLDGRGRPGNSGPLDGDGRRSIYAEVRRNFLSPMMLAFDAPVPASTVGRRTVSNVPAQALILMNDPLVVEQSKVWAKRLGTAKDADARQRITQMYLAAFSRPPSEIELTAALNFLDEQGAAYSSSEPGFLLEEQVWADLCHVLLNVKEFVFVN